MEGSSLTSAWDHVVTQVNPDELGPAHAAFLQMVKPLGDIEGTILLAVPNDFTSDIFMMPPTFVRTANNLELYYKFSRTAHSFMNHNKMSRTAKSSMV